MVIDNFNIKYIKWNRFMREGLQVGLKKRQVGWKQSLPPANFTIRVQALFCKRELKPLSRTGLLYQLQLSSRMCQAKRLLNTGDRLVEPFGDFSSLTVVDHKAFVFPDQLADGEMTAAVPVPNASSSRPSL